MEACTCEKTPAEDLPFEFDLKDWATFQADPPVSATVKDWDGNALSGITVATPVFSGTILQARIRGGTLDTTYQIRFLVSTTTNDYAGEIDVLMYVRQPEE